MIKKYTASEKIRKGELVVMTKKGTVKKTITPKKTTLEDVFNVLRKWEKDNDVMFFGGFASFDKDYNIVEDRLICFGDKEGLKLSLKDFNNFFKADKNEFINW